MPTPLLTNRQLGPDVARANLLVNGGFEIWQRGSGPFTVSLCADTWRIGTVGTDTLSISRNTANVDGGSAVCAASTFTLGTGAGGTNLFQQLNLLADGPDLASKTISVSVRVQCSTANAVRVGINNLYASASHWTYSPFHTGSGTYQTLSVTVTMDPTATYCQIGIYFAASCTAYLDNAMLVVGSQPANYVPMHPADDLARCLRYYETIGDSYLDVIGYGANPTTSIAQISTQFVAIKAVAPTVTVAPSGVSILNAGGLYTPTSVAVSGATKKSTTLACSLGGLTVGQGTYSLGTGNAVAVIVEANP